MKKNSFIFNTNRCVGCNACAAGCSIENGTDLMMNWREVNTGNKIKHPGLPVFHFSLACNHCEDAPCMSNCPALAYTRDEDTGAIIHHAEACIGCTYCTWACPYDAPKFNPATNIVEKCNFCVDRISDGKKPACVEACPVDALDFGQLNLSDEDRVTPGFVDMGIKPSIQLVPLREENTTPKIENIDKEDIHPDKIEEWLPKPKDKVALDKEWTLVLFTLIVSGLVGWFAVAITHLMEISPVFSPITFVSLAAISVVLSSFHIGKKLRMWRFVLNPKGSWLSREIISYSLFTGFSAIFFITNNSLIGWLALVFGILSLISVDMVYQLLRREDGLKLHSAMVIFTAVLIWSFLTDSVVLFGLIILVKFSLYIGRKLILRKKNFAYHPLLSGIRIVTLILPIVLIQVTQELSFGLLFSILMIGELIDRAEFYYESDVITPEKQLRNTN